MHCHDGQSLALLPMPCLAANALGVSSEGVSIAILVVAVMLAALYIFRRRFSDKYPSTATAIATGVSHGPAMGGNDGSGEHTAPHAVVEFQPLGDPHGNVIRTNDRAHQPTEFDVSDKNKFAFLA